MNEQAPARITASQWRQIVNGATETAIISTDRQGNVTGWNVGATNILGWTEIEVLGQSVSRIFVEEDRIPRLAREIEDAITLGRGGGEEGWRLRKDGSRFWAFGELSPIREGGELVGFIKILRDRTAHRQVRMKRTRSGARLRCLIELGPLWPSKWTSISWFKL